MNSNVETVTSTAIEDRIRAAHSTRCDNWETWETRERDKNGSYIATWTGCQACGVQVLMTAMPVVREVTK